jgi:hypothetical protein
MNKRKLLEQQVRALTESGIMTDCFSCKRDDGSPSGIATRYHDIAIDFKKSDHEKTDSESIQKLTIPELVFCGLLDVPYDQKLSRAHYDVK